ncbi:Uncharacterized protein cmbei_7004680 [Cryptosporidium meleagridis]
MKVLVGLGCLLLIVAHILCVNAIHLGSPNYRTVYVSRKKIPTRPLPERFRGELYSDGSVGWLCSRRINGRWTGWIPVSEARVPPQMVKQLRSQLSRRPRRVPEMYRKRIISPSFEEFDQEPLPEDSFELVQPSITQQQTKQFTWDEEGSSDEVSPLHLQQVPSISTTSQREYNTRAGGHPVLRQTRIERRTIPSGIQKVYQVPTRVPGDPDEADIARYFEEQNTPPIAGRKGIKSVFKDAFKAAVPDLELASPIFSQSPSTQATPPQGYIPIQPQHPSEYDLNRMQWRFFLTSYNPEFDNVRIIKRIPPLGMKLSKTVSECTNNYHKAFKLHYLTVSGMMFSNKINRVVSNSINKELRQWCSGMMTNWYRQLQKMGLVVPKPNKFIR